jgi:signal transduction histidine kinase
MESSSAAATDLAAFADVLAARHDEIISSAQRAVRGDPRLAVAARLGRREFQDHLPQLLLAVEERLRAGTDRAKASASTKESRMAERHGRDRWNHGYNLEETVLEWRHLHECLLVELEQFADSHHMSMSAMRAAVRELALLLGEGVSESANEHMALQQRESAARAAELSSALEQARAIQRATSETWREALHDLRGSMGLVRNASAVLTHDRMPENAQVLSKGILKRGVSAVVELLEELTDLARLESGQERANIGAFDAAEVLTRLCSTTRPLAATRGLFLHTEGPASMRVNGDAMKVHRVTQNLLLNAIKFTEQGGVWVRWDRVDEPISSGSWTLTIQDSGPGMSGDSLSPVKPEAGSPESSPASLERSEGLGLAIVRRLCQLLEARVEVAPADGGGTTIRVTFPDKAARD